MAEKEGGYQITAAGRAFVTSENFRAETQRIVATLTQQGKSQDDIMSAVFVYTASCLLSGGSDRMEFDLDKMRVFVSAHQAAIAVVVAKALGLGAES